MTQNVRLIELSDLGQVHTRKGIPKSRSWGCSDLWRKERPGRRRRLPRSDYCGGRRFRNGTHGCRNSALPFPKIRDDYWGSRGFSNRSRFRTQVDSLPSTRPFFSIHLGPGPRM